MEKPFHTMENLFMQLGLAHGEDDIANFIASHRLDHDTRLSDAPFWSPAQAGFLETCLSEDSDWAEVVDQLNSQLRR